MILDINTPYIYYEKKISPDGYKLICITCAGSGASIYAGWQKFIGDSIEILPVQLPGRENRMAEKCITTCKEAAEKIASELAPYVESGNFSVFGHSMGGIIAFETVKYLEKIGKKADICFVSSTSIEDMRGHVRSSELDDDAFFERVSRYGAIDESSEILKFPEFKSIFMNILRADFNVIETYEYDGIKINCPIEAICGDSDPMETIENMSSWEMYTDKGVNYHLYTGGHFYFYDDPREVLNMIKGKIASINKRVGE